MQSAIARGSEAGPAWDHRPAAKAGASTTPPSDLHPPSSPTFPIPIESKQTSGDGKGGGVASIPERQAVGPWASDASLHLTVGTVTYSSSSTGLR